MGQHVGELKPSRASRLSAAANAKSSVHLSLAVACYLQVASFMNLHMTIGSSWEVGYFSSWYQTYIQKKMFNGRVIYRDKLKSVFMHPTT